MLKQSVLDTWNILLESKNAPQAKVDRYMAVQVIRMPSKRLFRGEIGTDMDYGLW